MFSRNSTRKPLNFIKSPIFTNTPCKSTCLYNAPSMRAHCCYFLPSQWAKRDTLMSRAKNCRETIFVSQLSRSCPHRGGNFERGRNALSCGPETVLEAFKETILGEGNCESKIVARQWGVDFCRGTSRCLAGPSGLSN